MTGIQNPSTGVQGTHPLFKKKPGALPLATLAMVAVLSGASGCGTTQAPVDCTAAGVTCEHTDPAPQAAAAKAAADKAAADAQATADAQAAADQTAADKATADKATADKAAADKQAAADKAAAAQKAAHPTIEDGQWEVGVDVPAGVYKVTAAVDPAGMCYWEITETGHPDNIISNDIVKGGKPTVTLEKGQDFTTRDCGTWAKR